MIHYALGCCINRGIACYKQFCVHGAALLVFYVDFGDPSMENIYILRIEGLCLHVSHLFRLQERFARRSAYRGGELVGDSQALATGFSIL